MTIIRAFRLLMQIAAKPDLAAAFLASPDEIVRQRKEAIAREFLAHLPIFAGEKEDTWNHENRIRTAFACARVWIEEAGK